MQQEQPCVFPNHPSSASACHIKREIWAVAQLGLVGVLWAARGRGKKEPDMTRQVWGSGSVGIRSVEVLKCGSVEVVQWE